MLQYYSCFIFLISNRHMKRKEKKLAFVRESMTVVWNCDAFQVTWITKKNKKLKKMTVKKFHEDDHNLDKKAEAASRT